MREAFVLNPPNSRVIMRTRAIVAIAALLTFASPATAIGQAPASPPASPANVARAVAWLTSQQGTDGGFVGLSGKSDPSATADAVVALAATGDRAAACGIRAALRYLDQHALVYAQSGAGPSAKLALAVIAAGGDPRSVNGVNPLILAARGASKETGVYGTGIFDHALVMLALAAAGEPVPPAAIDALRATQIEDGSWAFDASTGVGKGDSNTTAMVIQALAANGHRSDPMVTKALAFLKTVQAKEGGFAFQAASPLTADANSTALAVQAIIAAGQDPSAATWRDATGALVRFQNPSGAVRYNDAQPDDNLFATVQAIPALVRAPLPIVHRAPPAASTCPAATPRAAYPGYPRPRAA